MVGPLDEAIGVPPVGISDIDWKKLRDRVEVALSPRFDLAIRTDPAKFRLGWILIIALVLALGSAGLVRALPHLSIPQLNGIIAALAAISISGLIAAYARILALERLHRPAWRHPRPERVSEVDHT